ncbi:MAG: right-handed parallel beta-helix repeat-containing protein, partial [Candidatus Hydrogenedentes bacterium]|nr:right-handed parallel beta-helix repeat-containing protein [Candidatus Hydrogenedentota bacterium]
MTRYMLRILLIPALFALSGCLSLNIEDNAILNTSYSDVGSFLPLSFERDASVSYQEVIQQAIDESPSGATLRFPPGRYLLDDASGLRVPSHRTLNLEGATFVLSPELREDGQAFLLEDATGVTIRGGTIEGQRTAWPESVNISGIRVTGESSHLRFVATKFINLSSNGIGVFGESADAPIRHVWIEDIYTENCCNIYYDYLSEKPGPAEGSKREDQGNICFYYVEDFVVRGNYLDGSRSDGTHFMGCSNGQITDNQILNSQMGGFFLERCHNIVATGNIIRNNGSRGCTIERNSTSCILSNNVVEGSGREGLWAPAVADIVVANNIFRENGQKNDTGKDSEIRINENSHFEVVPANIRIEGNLFTSTGHSDGIIQVNKWVGNGIVIRGNSFTGPVRKLLLDPSGSCVVNDNPG